MKKANGDGKYPKNLITKKQLEAFWGINIKESASSSFPVDWKIKIAKNQSNMTAQDYAEFAGGTGLKKKDITKFVISGIEGRKVILSFYSNDIESLTNELTRVFIIKKDFVYTFNCTNRLEYKEYDCFRFDKILSTFEFLE